MDIVYIVLSEKASIKRKPKKVVAKALTNGTKHDIM